MAVLEVEVAADPITRFWDLYYQVRPQIETPENISKLIRPCSTTKSCGSGGSGRTTW